MLYDAYRETELEAPCAERVTPLQVKGPYCTVVYTITCRLSSCKIGVYNLLILILEREREREGVAVGLCIERKKDRKVLCIVLYCIVSAIYDAPRFNPRVWALPLPSDRIDARHQTTITLTYLILSMRISLL